MLHHSSNFCRLCGYQHYSLQPQHARNKLILKEANYKIVGQVEGEWSASYVLGIGGLSKKSLTTNAISEMYKNAQLKGNQQIINVTTTTSVEAWAFFYVKYRALAHGYIIEFEE